MREQSEVVVFIGCGYPMGGVLFLAHMGIAIHRALRNSKINFYFASIDDESQPGYWSVVHSCIPDENIIHASEFKKLCEIIAKTVSRYDRAVIHTAGGWGQTRLIQSSLSDYPISIRKKIRLIGTTHSYRNNSWLRIPMSMFQYLMYRIFYRVIIFQCSYAAERFFGGNWLLNAGRARIIPLGCEDFSNQGNTACDDSISSNLRTILEDESLFKFVYLAAFRRGKNQAWLVSAISPILKTRPNARMLLCGAGDTKEISLVRDIARQHGVESQVILPGLINRHMIPYVLSKCNCAIVASSSETFGHNFLEPMFAGIPVVGTKVGVGIDIVKDGETGYQYSLEDDCYFQRVVRKIIDDPQATATMGQRAKDIVSREYSHSTIALKHVNLYKEILEEA